MAALAAVVFDLYGTLLHLERSRFERELPRRLGLDRRTWLGFLRRVLLVTAFRDRAAFVARTLAELAPGARPELAAELLVLLDAELAGGARAPGALPLLGFLKRRGYRLGLISNLASPYREPCGALGLTELFDAIALSCEQGRAKPEPAIYLDLCARLGVAPETTLSVGDSLANDVEAPRRLGMQALRVGTPPPSGIETVAGLAWLDLERDLEPLLAAGETLALGGERVRLVALAPVADDEQGRYNLVARGELEAAANGVRSRAYFKRFLLPESAHVEHFAQELLAELGLATAPAGVLARREPIYWSREIVGVPFERPAAPSPALAHEIGRHCASAYLLANADLRPRNAFVLAGSDGARLRMIDHEHCLFNLALDTAGVEDPRDPRVLDRLGADELVRRTSRKVLSSLAMRRARRTFIETEKAPSAVVESFLAGWLEVHRRAQARRATLRDRLYDRVYRQPFLVVGTQAYRRSLATLDIEDLLSRIDRDPEAACAECL